jgi:GT2 family glycosyltransferase
MKIAVVILNWNGRKLLEDFLPSIIAFSPPEFCDIYVADNASTDDSLEFIKANFSTIKIIQHKTNEGYAKGYNDALSQIDNRFYALVNSDIEVTRDWLNPIIECFDKNPSTAIIQPKILDFKNKTHFEYAGAAGGFIDTFGFTFCRGRLFDSIEQDLNQYSDKSEIFWASGACLFIRSKVFRELKGFDENYFAHFEEIDLCWRAQNLNHKINYIGTSVVYHVGGATLNQDNTQKTYLNFRNNLFTLVKNLPSHNLFIIIFIRLIFDGIAGIKFLVELKPQHTFAIIRAHFSFYTHLKSYLKLRTEQPHKTKSYQKVNSVIWQFYLKNKKLYSDLDNI